MLKPLYYILMTQEDLLNSSVMEELLRERSTYYINKNKPIDFWLINRPLFIIENKTKTEIEKTNFFKSKKHLFSNLLNKNLDFPLNSYSTIVSTSYEYLKWLQLRIGYFEEINIGGYNYGDSLQFAGREYKSDGVFGLLVNEAKENIYNQVNNQTNKSLLYHIAINKSIEIIKKDKFIKEKLLKA